MKPEQNFEQWNDEMSRKYNIDTYREKSHWFIKWVEGVRQKWIVKFLEMKPDDKAIDLGCGAGHLLNALPAGNLTGVDLSDFSIELAKKRLGDSAELVKGDVTLLPKNVTNRKFDKIVCSEVIEHVLEPEKIINEIVKISTVSSLIVISIPNENIIDALKWFFIKTGIFKILFPNIPKRNTDEWHITRFNKRMFLGLISGKLEAIRVKRVPFLFLPVRYIFVCKKIV